MAEAEEVINPTPPAPRVEIGKPASPGQPKEKSRMSGEDRINTVDRVEVEIAIVIGRSRMPIHHLLRMGRGAVIELDANENDEVEILANDFPVARGQVIVQGKRIQVEVTSLIRRPEVEARFPKPVEKDQE